MIPSPTSPPPLYPSFSHPSEFPNSLDASKSISLSPNSLKLMGSRQNQSLTCRCRTLHHFGINVLILLLIMSSSHLTMLLDVEGRTIAKSISNSKIGSRPPRCDRKCNACGHCEAIQVPTNPQIKDGHPHFSSRNSTTTVSSIFYSSRGDDYSNYKPMSWKCKCGNLIFNP